MPLTRLLLDANAWDDLERLEEFLAAHEDPLAYHLLDFVMQAIDVLRSQPGIGRPSSGLTRELIISRGRGGYLAKYVYQPSNQTVRVLRIRHQREAGYSDLDA